MSRYIYVVRSELGPVKIGLASKPLDRLTDLRVSSSVPLHLEYAAAIEGDAIVLERRAHAILWKHHQRGEWFAVDVVMAVSAVMEAAAELGCVLTEPLRMEELRRIVRRPPTGGRRGRPPGEKYAPPVPIRLTAEQLGAVDDWRRIQPDLPSRSEAIRRLVEQALTQTTGAN